MKNICLLLACLTFISVMPSYAVKLIIGEENDRVVYSRSSFPQNEIVVSDEGVKTTVKTSYYKSLNQNPEYYEYQLKLLGNDFRKELAGTKWYLESEEVVEPVSDEVVQYKSVHQLNIERLKRSSREAADYYMVDMAKDPENLLPSGYLE
jgi:hypothetical protein